MTPDTTYSGSSVHFDYMPTIVPGIDVTTAALAYAHAGAYIAPTTDRGQSPGKNPGTLLGSDWPSRTVTGSADAFSLWGEQFPDAVGVALHCGRSGLVVVDIDTEDPNAVPDLLKQAIMVEQPPYQTTRTDGRLRGHYFFRQPPGRRIGNSLGTLGKGWGDIRGTNGVVILAGSWHPSPDGAYVQRHAGLIPILPAYVADLMPDGADGVAAVTDADVQAFVQSTAHYEMAPNAAKGPPKRFQAEVTKGGARHTEAAAAAVWICREARAGGYPAGPALNELFVRFRQAVTSDPGSFTGRLREGGPEREFSGIVAWAVAQAQAEPEERLREARDRMARKATPPPVPPATPIEAPEGFSQPLIHSPPQIEGLIDPLVAESLTDAVVAQRIHDELLYDAYVWAVGFGWMEWTGRVWRSAPEETVVERIRMWAVEQIKPQLADLSLNRETRTRLFGLLDKYRLKGLAELSRGLCQVDPTIFDGDPDLLNTRSGIVDLVTGELIDHDPSRYMTRITAVPYTPGAQHPDWTLALSAVPADVADWLRIRFGQAITGRMTPDDVLLLLRGGGENGKSTLLAAIKSALGGYATYISDRVLLSDPGAHPTELTEFRGARLALTEELPEGAHLNVKRLKDVIGTPTMTARKIRQDSITWDSTHTLFLSTNYLPKVTETDHGTWRRLALVEFPHRFRKPGEPLEGPQDRHGDPTLRDRVKDGQEQQQAVLAWLVAGAREHHAAGRSMPPHPASVVQDTLDWRGQSDIVLRFWAECLEPDRQAFVVSRDLFEAFNEWLIAQGHKGRSIQAFTAQFGEHEITKGHGVFYQQAEVKEGQVQSFRSLVPGVMGLPVARMSAPPRSKVRAWWGVRFVQ